MGQYIELVKNVGIPVAIALIMVAWIGYFVIKVLWPFLIKQIDTAQAALREQLHSAHLARTEALKEFLIALDRRDALLKEMMEDHDRIRESIDRLTDEIRNNRGTRR